MANNEEVPNAVLPRPPVIRRTLKDFEEKTTRPATTGDPVIGRDLRSGDEDGSNSSAVAYTCIGMANDPQTNEAQACAYFLSALVTTIPSLEQIAIETLQNMGYGVGILTSNEFAANEFHLQNPPSAGRVLVMTGQLIFLLYKNISEVSYTRFMTNRTNAMKSLVGVTGPVIPEGNVDVVISLQRAKMFRQTLGAQYTLRRDVLMSMLSLQYKLTPSAQMYSYICNILCWNEMSAIMSVYQSLCLTKSPILRDLSVREELKNIYIAFKGRIKEEYPQYYRILKPHHETRKIEKARFPLLSAVAQELRKDKQGTVGQFAGIRESDTTQVNTLVNLHNAYMGIRPSPAPERYVNFLYELEFY